MRTNTRPVNRHRTHEGAPALPTSGMTELRRAVASCFLWEDQFYEDGKSIAARIEEASRTVPLTDLASLAVEARTSMRLRHAPLWLTLALLNRRAGAAFDTASVVEQVCRRADEPGELLAMYWKDGRKPLPAALRRGLGRALLRFDAYQLAKYDRPGTVRLRDVVRVAHPKARTSDQADVFKRLLDGSLESADTWEVALTTGGDARTEFERLLRAGKLGYLALLRNLRRMDQAGVDADLVRNAILARKGAQDVLPFRYVAAARAAPRFEPWLDEALCAAVEDMPVLPGETIVLVDVSGSMDKSLSAKSDLTRRDAGATLASVIHGKVRIFTFSEEVKEVAPRRGMAGVDAISRSQLHRGTYLGRAVAHVNRLPHDRLIVITDEESHDAVGSPSARHAYMINVASTQKTVGYGRWNRITGFSENVLRWIHEIEERD